jgi:heptosyltransferase-2
VTPDIIRAPNHVGDLVMSIPALDTVPSADVVVPRAFLSLLALTPRTGALIPFDRGRLLHAARDIRAHARSRGQRYASGVLLTRSFSSAAMFKLAGVRNLRGTDTDGRRMLLSSLVDPAAIRGRSRTASYYQLVTGSWPDVAPVPVIAITTEQKAAWWAHSGLEEGPIVGVFPGGNASSRRWDAARFAEVVQRLGESHRIVVFGGPDDTAVTKQVAGERGIDMGGRTSLAMLAAALSTCDLLITNDSGPLHIGAAVGTRTLSLWGAGDPKETAVTGAAHALLRHPELPCVPCVKNECPRNGQGYVLPEARIECLRLIAVPDVLSAAQTMLTR